MSRKTFGGWGFAPDAEWGLILPHIPFYLRVREGAVADPGGNPTMPPPNPAMAPIQSDSLAINFEFDIRTREVRLSSSCFFLYLH